MSYNFTEDFQMSKNQDFSSTIIEALGLPGLEIEKVKRGSRGEFLIYAKPADKEVNCRRCGKKTKPYGLGRELKIRHLSIFGEPTYIIIRYMSAL